MTEKFTAPKIIAITQRLIIDQHGEIRDSLDRRWYDFLYQSGYQPLLIPNHNAIARDYLQQYHIHGFLLSGGGDIHDDDLRGDIEDMVIDIAIKQDMPLLGICRGMQKLQYYFDIPLKKCENHIMEKQEIIINNKPQCVNSYHQYGCDDAPSHDAAQFDIWAIAHDGVIKAIKHRQYHIAGMMWHPERINDFRADDINYVKDFFQ